MIYGYWLYGHVDYVPGMFHVATRFFHFFFFPLVPLRTFVVLEGTQHRGSFQGRQIRLSLKSILVAYLKGLLFVSGGAMMIIGLARTPLLVPLAVLAVALGSSPTRWLKATPERAAGLATQLGVSAEQ